MNPVITSHATLYTFSTFKPGKLIQVVRITDSAPADWLEWPKNYRRHCALTRDSMVNECVGIAAVEIVDQRTKTRMEFDEVA